MIRAAKKVVQKPSTVRISGSSQSVRESIKALMIRVNKPRVRMIRGQVKNIMIGRINAFINPNIPATRKRLIKKSVPLPCTVTPGISHAVTPIATARIAQRISKDITIYLPPATLRCLVAVYELYV